MKTSPALAAFCLLTTSLPLLADTFTLKDGTTLEAKVLKEDAESYTLEVQVTKSIKDERAVLKADVVKVSREQPDLKAFEPIAKLVPTPDLLSEDEYLTQIAQVSKFIKDHPSSTKVREAKPILDTLKKEAGNLTNGGVKVHGKFVSPEEYKANAYDLDARVKEATIRGYLAKDQTLSALRAFVDFDKDYQTTLAYGALAPTMRQVIQEHTAEAKQALLTLDSRIKTRQTGLDQMTPDNRGATAAAIEEEATAVAARYKSEKESLKPWVTPGQFHRESLDETVKYGEAELKRLATVKSVLGVDGGKAYRDLYTAVHGGGDLAAVTAAMTAAKDARIPASYLTPLEEAAKGRK